MSEVLGFKEDKRIHNLVKLILGMLKYVRVVKVKFTVLKKYVLF